MAVINEQMLIDAAADAQSLEDIVNGAVSFNGTGIVTTRLGQNIKTAAKIMDELAGNSVLASATFDNDNVIVRSDSTGRNVQKTNVRIDDSDRYIVGLSAVNAGLGISPQIQVNGLTAGTTAIHIAHWANSPTAGGTLNFSKSRSGTIGTYGTVSNGDILGSINFYADDGTDIASRAARIWAAISTTPGSNDVPADLIFGTAPDGADEVVERLRIYQDSTGLMRLQGSLPKFTLRDTDGNSDASISNNSGNIFYDTLSTNRDHTFQAGGVTKVTISGNGYITSIRELISGNASTAYSASALVTKDGVLDLANTNSTVNSFLAINFRSNAEDSAAICVVREAGNESGFRFQLRNGSTFEAMGINKSGVPYFTTIHNNAQAQGAATKQELRSGTYTPTLTNTTNIAASTASPAQWFRVGNVVTVSGVVTIDPTATGAILLGISLPVASNFSSVDHCAGVAFCQNVAGQGGSILGDGTNDRARLDCTTTDASNKTWAYTFTYVVI